MREGGGGISPRNGTYIVSGANCLSALMSIFIIKLFRRRTLLIWGHFFIGVAHCLVGIFVILEFNNGVIAMIAVFLFIYENSSGPIAWLYAVETVIDSGMGICLFTIWGTVCVLS